MDGMGVFCTCVAHKPAEGTGPGPAGAHALVSRYVRPSIELAGCAKSEVCLFYSRYDLKCEIYISVGTYVQNIISLIKIMCFIA